MKKVPTECKYMYEIYDHAILVKVENLRSNVLTKEMRVYFSA